MVTTAEQILQDLNNEKRAEKARQAMDEFSTDDAEIGIIASQLDEEGKALLGKKLTIQKANEAREEQTKGDVIARLKKAYNSAIRNKNMVQAMNFKNALFNDYGILVSPQDAYSDK